MERRELRLLEVGLDPGVAGLDQAGDGRAGGDELADIEARDLADDAVGRGDDRGLVEIARRGVARRERRADGRMVVGGDIADCRRARRWPRRPAARPRSRRCGRLERELDVIERRVGGIAALDQRLLAIERRLPDVRASTARP